MIPTRAGTGILSREHYRVELLTRARKGNFQSGAVHVRSETKSTYQDESAFEWLVFDLDGVRLHRPSSDGLLRLPCQIEKRSFSVRRSFC